MLQFGGDFSLIVLVVGSLSLAGEINLQLISGRCMDGNRGGPMICLLLYVFLSCLLSIF